MVWKTDWKERRNTAERVQFDRCAYTYIQQVRGQPIFQCIVSKLQRIVRYEIVVCVHFRAYKDICCIAKLSKNSLLSTLYKLRRIRHWCPIYVAAWKRACVIASLMEDWLLARSVSALKQGALAHSWQLGQTWTNLKPLRMEFLLFWRWSSWRAVQMESVRIVSRSNSSRIRSKLIHERLLLRNFFFGKWSLTNSIRSISMSISNARFGQCDLRSLLSKQ